MEKLKLEEIPDYDLLDEEPLAAILESAQRLLDLVCKDPEDDHRSWTFRESVWPALGAHHVGGTEVPAIRPRLVLLPLSRIGAESGFSGSKIHLGYFSDVGERKIFPSLPLVIKLAEIKPGKRRKLEEEKSLADLVRPYLAYHKDSFAVPLWLNEVEGYDILWSPFALTELVEWRAETSRLSLSARDLRTLLKGQALRTPIDGQTKAGDEAQELVRGVYKILQPLHRRARPTARERRTYSEEYTRYIRDFDEWGGKWVEAWGEMEYVSDLGGDTFDNPIRVLKQILHAAEVPMLLGAVHGDLHPGNIMYSHVGAPSVIDFGWASPNAHVAKDFVLLECNLRFTYLRSDLPLSDVATLAKWIDLDWECGPLTDPAALQAQRTIKEIRNNFKMLADDATEWDLEYVVPLFLVAFGLLRFLDENWNQIAARRTVLELSRYLATVVLPKLTIPVTDTDVVAS